VIPEGNAEGLGGMGEAAARNGTAGEPGRDSEKHNVLRGESGGRNVRPTARCSGPANSAGR